MVGRQDNQGDSLTNLRKVIADLARVIAEQVTIGAEMHENLAIMKCSKAGIKVRTRAGAIEWRQRIAEPVLWLWERRGPAS